MRFSIPKEAFALYECNLKCNESLFVAFWMKRMCNKLNQERSFYMERESKTLEYKEQVTKTFLKTVFAYANYRQGRVLFGVTDDKRIIGISNQEKACLDIENMINDNISPKPEYTLEPNLDGTIYLTVEEGVDKPYLYKGKAYKRNDSATIEVDRLEYNRLILMGRNQTFEEQINKEQALTFQVLENTFIKELEIEKLSTDILKTLELLTPNGKYNHAAALLADHNDFKGIDMIKFGKTISEIKERKSIEYVSILTQFYEALQFYRRYYQYEKIDGVVRKKIDMIPESAFREAIANALVHRLWDVNANIKISMFDDRIEISSPGSLPSNISYEEYINGQISILRNPIIGNVFFRLHYIERFGTGIKRINESYHKNLTKPVYRIFENSILVILPILDVDLDLNDDEKMIVTYLRGNKALTRVQLDQLTGFNKAKTVRILNQLLKRNIIRKTGKGKVTKYLV